MYFGLISKLFVNRSINQTAKLSIQTNPIRYEDTFASYGICLDGCNEKLHSNRLVSKVRHKTLSLRSARQAMQATLASDSCLAAVNAPEKLVFKKKRFRSHGSPSLIRSKELIRLFFSLSLSPSLAAVDAAMTQRLKPLVSLLQSYRSKGYFFF